LFLRRNDVHVACKHEHGRTGTSYAMHAKSARAE